MMLSETQEAHASFSEIPLAYQVCIVPPAFTTPTLDFAGYSAELLKLVDKLYDFKDNYFVNEKFQGTNSEVVTILKQRDDRIRLLRDQTLFRFNQLTTPPTKKKTIIKDCLEADDFSKTSELSITHPFDPTLSANQKSMYHFLRGRILDIEDSVFSKQAEEDLSKAVKLNPKFVDGWNSLGECLWKKGDRSGSIHCFKAGLRAARSIGFGACAAIRFFHKYVSPITILTFQVTKAQLEESIALCKEAIASDILDGKSWHGLGTSYIKLFFDVTRDPKDLQRALAAYNKAVCSWTTISSLKEKGSSDPDLYRNRAIIHQYLELYQQAIQDYKRAIELDPNFTETCSDAITRILQFSRLMNSTIQKRTIDARKRDFRKVIPSAFEKLELARFGDLALDETNASKLLRFRVVGSLQHDFASAFIGDDGACGVGSVIIYNIRMDLVKPNDIILIAAPKLMQVSVQDENEIVSFKTVRAEDPKAVAINGQILDTVGTLWTSISVDAIP